MMRFTDPSPLFVSAWTLFLPPNHNQALSRYSKRSSIAFATRMLLTRAPQLQLQHQTIARRLASPDAFDAAQRRLRKQKRPWSATTAISMIQSGGVSGQGAVPFRNIGKAEMKEILEDYTEGGREDSQYCVIDVRTEEEVQCTGKLAENVYTLPIQTIMRYNAFAMDDDDFEEAFGFEKPQYDETIVFTCKSGIRSVYACQAASMAGYSNLINYMGGSSEWFHS
ncbi:hypothetical protein ACA910_017147 [Epithemia clementina (nom. ined.)]